MPALLLLGLLLQGGKLTIISSVDRDRIEVGDEITYSAHAVLTSTDPVRATLPAEFDGFQVVGSMTEHTDVSVDAAGTRTYVLEVRLRATQPGDWRLWGVILQQGNDRVVAPAVEVTIHAPERAVAPSAMNSKILGLLQRSIPPSAGDVGVTATTSADTIYVGDQLDVLTTAWFPRELRSRLRRPPTLKPPVLDGVWNLPQTTIPGIVASRKIGNDTYDLFVSHQVVFPLTPGVLAIPAAELEYGVPTGRHYFSDEKHFELRSPTGKIIVLAPPAGGRPAGATAAPVARSVTVEYQLPKPTAHAGELVPVHVAVHGQGNLTLWPAPDLAWPTGARVYTDKVDDKPETHDGRLGGTKTFRFFILADSAGSLILPAIHYPFFDPATNRYREASTESAIIPVLPSEVPLERRDILPLASDRGSPLAMQITDSLGGSIWLLVFLAPAVAVWRAARRRVPPQPARASADPGMALVRFQKFLHEVVPDAAERQRASIVATLRQTGFDRTTAESLACLYDDVRRVRYGPGSSGDRSVSDLAREVAATLRKIPRRVRARVAATGLVASLWILGFQLSAQTLDGASLYQRGAYQAAKERFALAAQEAPTFATNWYNLGAAAYMTHADGEAAAAWIRARELTPRSRIIQSGLIRLRLLHDELRDSTNRLLVTPSELLLLALLAWIVGWAVVALRRRFTATSTTGLGLALMLALSAVALQYWEQRPRGIVVQQLPLRLSPHGLATQISTLNVMSEVPLEQRRSDWLLVRDAFGRRGWVPAGAVAVIHGID